jgi:plasmid maintenance system killer protein
LPYQRIGLIGTVQVVIPAVWVTGNWRITFQFEGADVTYVDLVDYH